MGADMGGARLNLWLSLQDNVFVKIAFLETVASTQDVCFELLAEDREAAVVARTQSSGRGRFQRRWHSPPGGLWLSVGSRDFNGLKCSFAGPVAVCRVLDEMVGNVGARIKPPNDVIVNEGKLAGVLVETKSLGTVVGIGLNIANQEFPPGVKGVSLKQLGFDVPDRKQMALALVQELFRLDKMGLGEIVHEYRKRLCCLGKTVVVNGVKGRFSGVDDRGFLVGQTLIPFGRFSGMEVL